MVKIAAAISTVPSAARELVETDLGPLPKDWKIIELRNAYDFQNGVNAPAKDYGRGIRFANVLEVLTHSHLCASKIPGRVTISNASASTFSVKNGDILFNRTSETQDEIGLASVYCDHEPIVFGGFVIRARQTTLDFHPKYAGYAFRAPFVREQIISSGQGAVRANIGQQSLRRVLVPLPSRKEQEAIAEALSDADALIESLEALIAKKRLIKHGAMQELLTGKCRLPGFCGEWHVTRLADFGNTYGGLTGKSKKDFGHGDAHYIPFMSVMSNVIINTNAMERVDVRSVERQNHVRAGDLFFNGSSETPEEVGMCSVLLEDFDNLYLNSFCFGFRFNDLAAASGLYLAWFFRGEPGRQLLSSLAQGATRYNLSKRALANLEFQLPPLSEQIAIAETLSDLDTEIVTLEAQKAKAQQIKQGMMQELLTGRVRLI